MLHNTVSKTFKGHKKWIINSALDNFHSMLIKGESLNRKLSVVKVLLTFWPKIVMERSTGTLKWMLRCESPSDARRWLDYSLLPFALQQPCQPPPPPCCFSDPSSDVVPPMRVPPLCFPDPLLSKSLGAKQSNPLLLPHPTLKQNSSLCCDPCLPDPTLHLYAPTPTLFPRWSRQAACRQCLAAIRGLIHNL